MFSVFKRKTPPPGEIRERKVAFVGDDDKDCYEMHKTFESIGIKCICFSSDQWEKLLDEREEFEAILIDFHIGGDGLMSISINETLLRNAYPGRMFLLAHGSMEMYHEEYATVLMMDAVKDDPMKVFDSKAITEATVVAETVFMKKSITNGRSK